MYALELCAGGGGQALGLEAAGFHHSGLVEYEPLFCTTLRLNRPHWNVLQQDVRHVRAQTFEGVDLVAAGVPCPPFSVAGKQLGADDERDMFPATLEIISFAKPRAVLIENVPGLAAGKFESYRANLLRQLQKMGYLAEWKVLQAADFDVPQLRPRFVLVALRPKEADFFAWPIGVPRQKTVGGVLVDLMGRGGWLGAEEWASKANGIAPTIVGGSKKHGGPDLGPTRAKAQWRQLGVNGIGIADEAPDSAFPLHALPKLTLQMVARLQSFPDDWVFSGGKTASYRQVGNAFPPAVAESVGRSIYQALTQRKPKLSAADKTAIQSRLFQPVAEYRVTRRKQA